jgi:predicted transcriptional regulator
VVTIELDAAKEQRLREIAASQGQDLAELARRVLEDFLDVQSWEADTSEDWAEASAALAPEILEDDAWPDDEANDGPR